MEYSIFEHRHNYSVWAAARAAQRGFTTVDNLREALEYSGIREYVCDDGDTEIDDAAFAKRHSEWCNRIIEFLKNIVEAKEKVTFGRAAKLVTVYIKTMVVVGPHSKSNLARVAHPPIDRIILQNLSADITLSDELRKELRKANWTQFDQNKYNSVVRLIQNGVPNLDPFWLLERYWRATDNAEE